MRTLNLLVVIVLLLGAGGAAFVYSGLFPIAADEPHSRPVYWLMATMRDRAIERASRGTVVPPLNDPRQQLTGARDYQEMCASCHREPGGELSELARGLYPPPPNLTAAEHSGGKGEVRHHFWVIKHGIKMTGMPAWGPTHEDQRIWAIVAFLKRLPALTPEQYQHLVARTDDHHNHHH